MDDQIILKIKELMTAKNVSVQDFAKGINRSRQNIYDIFGKRQTMTLSFLMEVSSFFKIPITHLFTDSKDVTIELEEEISKMAYENSVKENVMLFLTQMYESLMDDLEFIYAQHIPKKELATLRLEWPLKDKYLNATTVVYNRLLHTIFQNIEAIVYLFNRGYFKKVEYTKYYNTPDPKFRYSLLYDFIKTHNFIKEEKGRMCVKEG